MLEMIVGLTIFLATCVFMLVCSFVFRYMAAGGSGVHCADDESYDNGS